jgi:hypothetical protein
LKLIYINAQFLKPFISKLQGYALLKVCSLQQSELFLQQSQGNLARNCLSNGRRFSLNINGMV